MTMIFPYRRTDSFDSELYDGEQYSTESDMDENDGPIEREAMVYQETKEVTFCLIVPGCVAQSVTFLATDACLTADTGVASSILSRSHTFMEIDHEIILRTFSSLPLNHS